MITLVTGGTGMLGQQLVSELQERYPEQQIIALSRAECNLTEQSEVLYAFKFLRPHTIWHCAGMVGGIEDNITYSYDYLMQNAEMGLNVVRYAVESGVRKLWNIASSCMYPARCKQPMNERDLGTGSFEPTNDGYAAAKYLTMMACEKATRQHQLLRYRTFIPCNLYGPKDNYTVGGHVLAALVRKVCDAKRSGAEHITIWGSGAARRELMHVVDCARIMVLIDKQNYPAGASPINIGSGVDHSIMELALMVGELAEWKGTVYTDLSMPAGMDQKLLDIHYQRDLGLLPHITLQDGIKEMIKEYNDTYH